MDVPATKRMLLPVQYTTHANVCSRHAPSGMLAEGALHHTGHQPAPAMCVYVDGPAARARGSATAQHCTVQPRSGGLVLLRIRTHRQLQLSLVHGARTEC